MTEPNSYRISGRIRDERNRPAAGYIVQAFDKVLGILLLHPDDRLGKATTAGDGSFEITFGKETFKEWFTNQPKVYLVVRDQGGKVVLQTQVGVNTTGDVQFQVKLGGGPEVDALAPNIYQDSMKRIGASFSGMQGTLDMSKVDVQEMSEVLARAVDSYTLYRDEIFQAVAGYDGIQVPREPRKERHDHVSRWDRPVLPT